MPIRRHCKGFSEVTPAKSPLADISSTGWFLFMTCVPLTFSGLFLTETLKETFVAYMAELLIDHDYIYRYMYICVYIYICMCVNIWGQQHSFSTHEQMFLWKCLDLKETRTPNLRIHDEYSNHLSYQGRTFAAPCFWILALAVKIFLK